MTKFIGFTGPIGSGKDLCAEILSGMLSAPIYAMADPVREVASALFNIPVEDFKDQSRKQMFDHYWNLTLRDMLRLVGTEMGRDVVSHDVWIRNLVQRTHELHLVIVPDIRFQDEANFIRNSGILVHLLRPDNPYADQMSSHRSDLGVEYIPEIDVRIINNSSKAALRMQLYDTLFDFIAISI